MALSLLRTNRNYRLVLSASAVSNLGDGVAAVAVPWLASLLTRDPVLIAAVATARMLPWFLFSLPAGVLTDRADRRRLIVRADIARVALTLCVVGMVLSLRDLPLADGHGPLPIVTLAVLAFLIGSAEVIRDNAAQTLLPAVVAHADLERANGQLGGAERIMGDFVGPPLAGFLIAAGIAVPFGFNAAAFAVSAAVIWLIALPPRRSGIQARFLPALAEGFAFMRAHPAILRLAVMLGVINAVYFGGLTILVLYAQEVLGLSAAEYGLLLTSVAVGGVAGAFAAPWIAGRIGMRASLVVALASFVLPQLALGLFSSVPVAVAAMVIEAAGGMLWNVVTVSYRQRIIPDAILGRVNSVYRFFGWGAMPFGALAAGALVAVAETARGRDAALHAPYLAGAVICAVLLVYGVRALRFDA
ncbi:MFS transporter [Rhodobacterales bacterium HKCCE2091]|nr:MFS transporter [Rhodobacterales bacterium HKCCE2091]